MKSRPLIGIADLAMNRWTAGGIVSRTMALSLQAAGAEVMFLTAHPENAPRDVRHAKLPELTYLPGEWTLRKISGRDKGTSMAEGARRAGVDVLLPDVEAMRSSSFHTIGWIPDFQHLHLGELYSAEQKDLLSRAHRKLARRASLMLFSSQDCRRDFVEHYPDFAAKARVASFPSILAFEPPTASPTYIFEKYHLPERFLVVINQFWRHKNHRIVPEALAILGAGGLQVPVVMAGLPVDYRDRNNDALSETLQAAVRGNVWSQCFVLGKVPREDLVALLRTAAAVIQPSRFEGWNTTLQDAKAIGCPVIVSDLGVHREQCPKALGFFNPDDPAAVIQPSRFEGWNTTLQDAKAIGCPVIVSDLGVHREQCPKALGFFNPDDPAALAEVIAANWPNLPARPNSGEGAALTGELDNARAYGRQLEEICREIA